MYPAGNLWAVGFDSTTRAKEFRTELSRCEGIRALHVLDAIVVTRLQDGSFIMEQQEKPTVTRGSLGYGILGFMIGLVVLEPLVGAAIGATFGGVTTAALRNIGISDEFINEVKDLMAPGTSAVFLLTSTENPDAVERQIRGLGGAILKTSVDIQLAERVQASLDAPRTPTGKEPPLAGAS